MSSHAYSSTHSDSLPDYSRGIVISVLIHCLIIGFLVVRNFVTVDDTIDYRQAIRVDIVGLPEKIKEENLPLKPIAPEKKETKPAEPEPTPAEPAKVEPVKTKPKPLPTKVDKTAVNLDKAKQKAALQKLKNLSAIEQIQQDLDKEKKAKASKPAPIKGNIISPGTDLTGLDKLQHQNYEADLDRHIKKYWALPQWLTKKNLKAQIIIRVDEKGQLLSRELVKSSGNPSFDDQVLRTVDEANPLPAPPLKLTAKARVDGIVIDFEE